MWAEDKEMGRVWVPPSDKFHAAGGGRERFSDSGVEGGAGVCCCHGLQGCSALLPAGVSELLQRSRHHWGESPFGPLMDSSCPSTPIFICNSLILSLILFHLTFYFFIIALILFPCLFICHTFTF